MLKHLLIWFCKSVSVFLLGIPVTLLGFPLVALALPFRIEHPSLDVPFSDPRQTTGVHRFVTLPRWARWWSNEFDGAEGDRRGWWNTYCLENYEQDAKAFYSMWQWLAVRNPANYWARVVTGCDVSRCVITKLAGQDVCDEDTPGWHFLVAESDSGTLYHYFGFCLPWWFDPTHMLFGRFGWKIKLSHNTTPSSADETDRFKGSVFRMSLWKEI